MRVTSIRLLSSSTILHSLHFASAVVKGHVGSISALAREEQAAIESFKMSVTICSSNYEYSDHLFARKCYCNREAIQMMVAKSTRIFFSSSQRSIFQKDCAQRRAMSSVFATGAFCPLILSHSCFWSWVATYGYPATSVKWYIKRIRIYWIIFG